MISDFANSPEAILQRVSSASVTVEKQLISQIGRGILVLAAIGKDDTHKEAETLASKVLKLKLWDDDAGGRVRHCNLNPLVPAFADFLLGK